MNFIRGCIFLFLCTILVCGKPIAITYPVEDDRLKYFGAVVDGVPEGFGSLWYKNGDVYRGKFSQGFPHDDAGRFSHKIKKSVVLTKSLVTNIDITYPMEDDRKEYHGAGVDGVPEGTGTLWYKNGDVYRGEFLKGAPHDDDGRLSHKEGELTITKYGKWVEGIQTGEVSETIYSRDYSLVVGEVTYDYSYTGEFRGDVPYGKGTMRYHRESYIFFEGYFINGKKFGHGKLILPKDRPWIKEYAGEFQNDVFHGKGVLVKINGFIYDCFFFNGLCHGKGTATNPKNGLYYTGDWVNGEFSGKGKLKISNGVYEGGFLNGLYHGEGTMVYADGTEYIGKWVNNIRVKGRLIFASKKDFYEGTFNCLNEQFHGKGTMTYSDGHVYIGDWENGMRSGQGELIYPNGKDFYVGGFKNNKYDGKGQLCLDNIVSVVKFANGNQVFS